MIAKDEKLLTIKEVLELSGVSRFTLYRDIQAGDIPAINFGRNVRIKESDAKAYAADKAKSKRVAHYKNKEVEE